MLEPDAPEESPARGRCPICNVILEKGHTGMANGREVCVSCVHQVARELQEEQEAPPRWSFAIAAGLGGALVGAGVWAAVAALADVEVGAIAVLVGFLAGVGVTIGAGKARGPLLQLAASLIAVAGLVVGKYLTIAIVLNQILENDGEPTVSWFDGRVIAAFPANLEKTSGPFDILWIVLAVVAAYRVPARTTVRHRP